MDIEVRIVNAFTDDGVGGNPAGVVLDADALDAQRKLAVAQAVGLSETAFVSRSRTAAFKLDFFTPTRQIAHCGHATIATFSLLRQLGRIGDGPTSKETIDGNRAIVVSGDAAFMEQRAPSYRELAGTTADHAAAVASLRMSAERLDGTPTIVDTGNAFLVVPLRSSEEVAAIEPDFDRIAAISEQFDLIGYYVYSRDASQADRDAGARMFAPRYGIREEAATGMAAGPLACYLHDRRGVAQTDYRIEQGRLMSPPSPSLISVQLDVTDGAVRRLMAGGRARSMRTFDVTI